VFYWGLIIGVFIGCFIGILILGLCVMARKGDAAEAHLEYKDSVNGKVAGETAS